ncbi:monocarboxylate transporter 12-like [Haliotis asinina]|uniref:monocarboxylate transporter 12-like n=1 Tax=Haliotis asinina TaxID=109174 RepID=UPI0035326315
MDTGQDRDTDIGYAWVALFAATFSNFITGMLIYSPGVFNTAILDEIENDLSRTSWIGSTLVGTITISGPVAGVFTSRFGCKAATCAGGILVLIGMSASSFIKSVKGLLLTNGVLTGLGAGLAVNAGGTIPGYYFKKRLPISFGVSTAGTAMGLFAGGPLVAILLQKFTLSGAFLIFGGIASNLCVAGALMRPRREAATEASVTRQPHDYKLVPVFVDGNKVQGDSKVISDHYGNREDDFDDHEKIQTKYSRNQFVTEGGENIQNESTVLHSETGNSNMPGRCLNFFRRNMSLITANGFLFYNLSLLFLGLGENAILFHLPNYAHSKNSTRLQSANLFTAIGLCSLLSRLVTGIISNDKDISIILLHVSFLGIAGILALLFPLFSHAYPLQMLFSALYGLYGGGLHSILSPMTVECVGVSHLAVGYGMTHLAIGIGYILGPPVASIIYESSKDYDHTYFFGGGCLMAASVCAAAVPVYRRSHGS